MLIAVHVSAQHCNFQLTGVVQDHATEEPLHLVNIYIEEIGTGVVTEDDGKFEITGLCAGEYHVVFSHIGCETVELFVVLDGDTTMVIELDHSAHLLEGVTIAGEAGQRSTQAAASLNLQSIQDKSDLNLSTLVSSITGVSALKSGSGIAKPIIHGLYGNRVAVLNNGIAQSGQQWGNDHAPEIDPSVANNIQVIKGVAALRYPGSGLGGVLLVEPQRIQREPHLHGRAGYYFETNGRTHGANLQLQQYKAKLGWKLNGSVKLGGDRRTPDYFLTNTGTRETNLALQIEKPINDQWLLELYGSSFNTNIGVLRGSHIGNLTDLESALNQEIPFFTNNEFSYTQQAPSQKVHHHLLKSRLQYTLNDFDFVEFTIAGQLNDRKEFDVRRGGRTEIPALSIQQYSGYGEARWHKAVNNHLEFDLGTQFNLEDNTNNPETGIFPLIPNYLMTKVSGYFTGNYDISKSTISGGLRYDYVYQSVATITQSIPRERVNYDNKFNNITTALGWTADLSNSIKVSANIGYATRNPAINELYSAGLHQGVSGIEEGDPSLQSEKSLKSTLSFQGRIKDEFSFEVLAYSQSIDNYIFLRPEEDFRLTIRGAFPVFTYDQTDARINGVDLSAQLHLHEGLHIKTSYSYIKGDDRSNNIPLIFMPPNSWNGSVAYELHSSPTVGSWRFENLSFGMRGRYVARQNHLLPEQDFMPAPDSYFLLGADFSTDIQMNKNRWRLVLRVDNLLNMTYRDYLNRLRYFSDDEGINVVLGLGLKF